MGSQFPFRGCVETAEFETAMLAFEKLIIYLHIVALVLCL
jgi:hypothetical protein